MIPGAAAGQGSMKWIRGRMLPDSPQTTPQRDRITAAAVARWGRAELTGPVAVAVLVVAQRPRSHFLPANSRRAQPVLRADAPDWAVAFPDLDKVQRLIGDALTDANVLRDDKQVARWEAVRVYGLKAATHIHVYDLTEGTPA